MTRKKQNLKFITIEDPTTKSCQKIASKGVYDLYKLAIDPKSDGGKLYPFAFLMNYAQATILSDANGFRQIGEWVKSEANVSLQMLCPPTSASR